ncbi:MAG: hypothetical protein LUG85_08235 [Clostridiales bacterium]|nr:hypothetical protein [Clostridiales bacterium]
MHKETSMFYERWMSYLKDDAKLCEIAIPGSHNAGTYGMKGIAKCQNGSLYEQYRYGVRYFDFRFHVGINGRLVFEHGVMGGTPLKEGLLDIKRMIENNSSEFFIFKIHYPEVEYLIGKLGRRYKQDIDRVNREFQKYIEPEKYAFTDFSDITAVTMGDIRKSGKRYILNWEKEGITGAVNVPVYDPWRPDYYGKKPDNFFAGILDFFRERPKKSMFCLYVQRTPGFGTEVGIKNPVSVEKDTRLKFHKFTEKISKTPELLHGANIFAGDFMTDSHHKTNLILRLNKDKCLFSDSLPRIELI